MSEARTVAIVGAGPVGLAAAARMCWSAASRRFVLEAGPAVGDAVRQWGPRAAVLAVGIQYRSARPRVCWRRRAGILPNPGSIRPAPNCWSAISNRSPARLFSRHTSTPPAASPTSAVSASTSSRPKAAKPPPFENSLSKRPRAPRIVRADAVIDVSGTWHSPNPAGANGLGAIGEKAGGGQDCLRDAGRAGETPRALCRQDRRGAGARDIRPSATLTDLAKLAAQSPETRPIWLLRGNDPAKAFGGGGE